MAKVLVTGGSGLIGGYVVKELLKMQHEIVIYDIKKNVYNQDNRLATFRWGSVLDPFSLSLAAKGCDYVIHLAALMGVQKTEKNKLACLYINIQGTINVLEASIKENIKKLVFTSSSEVYGESQGTPISEDFPLTPISVYGVSKLTSEEYLRAYKHEYGLDYSVVRYFNVYGDLQETDFVIPRFVKMVNEGRAPTVYGDGSQIRSFCHVEDAVRGTVDILFSEKCNSEDINIGSDTEPISIVNLAKKVIYLGKAKVAPQLIPYEESDRKISREIKVRVPSIAKAKALIGYIPRISLEEGIERLFRKK